jgi:hypothetical protein
MMETLVKDTTKVRNLNSPMPDEIAEIKNGANKVVKAALWISKADKQRFGKLKDELANNHHLGTEQYPNTFEKALRILGNYQATKANVPYRASPNNTGVAFLQRGGGHGAKKEGSGSEGDDMSIMTGQSGDGPKKKQQGEMPLLPLWRSRPLGA